jgi:hypothetical protein
MEQVSFDVIVRAIPSAQSPDDKAMAQIMKTRTVVICGFSQSNLTLQDDEPAAHRPLGQAGALFGK